MQANITERSHMPPLKLAVLLTVHYRSWPAQWLLLVKDLLSRSRETTSPPRSALGREAQEQGSPHTTPGTGTSLSHEYKNLRTGISRILLW